MKPEIILTQQQTLAVFASFFSSEERCHACAFPVHKCDINFDETAFSYSYKCPGCGSEFIEVYVPVDTFHEGKANYFPLVLWRIIPVYRGSVFDNNTHVISDFFNALQKDIINLHDRTSLFITDVDIDADVSYEKVVRGFGEIEMQSTITWNKIEAKTDKGTTLIRNFEVEK